MSDNTASTPKLSQPGLSGGRLIFWFNRRWMMVLSIILGLLVGLPFLAPVFMQLGWEKQHPKKYY